MRRDERHWYITVLASLYLVLCSSACAYYASIHLRANGGWVPLPIQLLCLGMAISAGLYFVKPRVGHRSLVILTTITLLAIGTSDPKATCFHFVVLSVLVFPFVGRWFQAKPGTNNRGDTGDEHGAVPFCRLFTGRR